jgi:hypothetical protein
MSELSLCKIFDGSAALAPLLEKIDTATKLSALVLATLSLAHALAVMILEYELNRRGREPVEWTNCPYCGSKIESKGFPASLRVDACRSDRLEAPCWAMS